MTANILFTIAIQVLKLLRAYYSQLTPEQLKELETAMKETFRNGGNMSSGVGE